MSNRSRRPVYGGKPKIVITTPADDTTDTVPLCAEECPGIRDAYLAVEESILKVQQSLQQFFEVTRAVSQFIARMSARGIVPIPIFVRLYWREHNPGVRFDINNGIHRLQIKDVYLLYGWNYLTDPLFQDALGLTLVD